MQQQHESGHARSAAELRRALARLPHSRTPEEPSVGGKVIRVMHVSRCVRSSDIDALSELARWRLAVQGWFCWVVDRAVELLPAVPLKGHLGLFALPQQLHEEVLECAGGSTGQAC
jgi:hypothetical protein